MKKTIGMVGVPIETVFFRDSDNFPISVIEAYHSGSTYDIRRYISSRNSENGNIVNLVDLGELSFGLEQKQGFFRKERSYGEESQVKEITLDMLFEERGKLLARKDEFDVMLCIGLSHFGALLLYEDHDFVARFDCHGDYHKKYKEKYTGAGYGCYMNTVERRFPSARIRNYGVRTDFKGERMDFFGERGFIGDNEHLTANHFDIDVDCFLKELMIANSRYCSDLQPEQVEGMIAKAKPKKIGIWEYRSDFDRGNGRRFIENVVFSCSS